MGATVTITWEGNNNDVSDHYNVYRSDTSPVGLSSPENTSNIAPSTNEFVQNGVADGTYYYVVEAVDADGNTETTAEYTVVVDCSV